ncbi:hypothetical protein DVH24_008634 [Malus domestica]|uniref:DNA-directed DNA polymerase n=1 Tax=Malus domestica TaxID=3750 RepID=A0A498JQL2_MALDO|nr:hypothetical protein DVH24_008634 [Malus domestica]
MDGRRHSVDIPISKTLVQLRRVRSLRDPDTNSMSKYSALVENVNWETNSNNDISVQFMNSFQGGSDKHRSFRSKNPGLYGLGGDCIDDFELDCALGKSRFILHENSEWIGSTGSRLVRSKQAEEFDFSGSDKEDVYGNKSLSDRHCGSQMDKGLALTCVNPLEDGDYEAAGRSLHLERTDQIASKRQSQRKNNVNSFREVGNFRKVCSPCRSASDSLSSHSASLFVNEEADAIDHNRPSCEVNCCWSRTPRFRGANLPFNVDEFPLLYKNADESALYEQKSLKHIGNERSPYPRSLSQKFRPKSFNELVGQNVVARSLLGAISRGRIASFYLFHGPRGTGKTSAARIFAAALNCLSHEEHRPCGLCCECVLYFSGRSGDIKEVDSVRINRRDRVRSLIKNAAIPPLSSRFKVLIIDECHLMHGETWATVLNSIDNLSQHVVFVMITPDVNELPRSAVSRSQRFHFPKVKDADIASRLGRICVKEGLEFDQGAVDFVASKSNGSLRDAEMVLDQLSLLGKKVTMALAYELIGVISDDELLGLLDMALSSDTSNTVIKARELMRSRVDPMQLISQLANLVMDILAGKCQDNVSEVRKKFCSRHTSEADLQKLTFALRIFSETEKQLRVSKNQTTWLTAALLQLSSVESSSSDGNGTKLCFRSTQDISLTDKYLPFNSVLWLNFHIFCYYSDGTSSTADSFKNLATCSCKLNTPDKLRMQKDSDGKLEAVWKRATDLCLSNSLKNFLKKQGKLSSLLLGQGLAIAELEFCHPDYVSKAEKSWKIIANSLQSICGCNVEIRINLVPCASDSKYAKVKKSSLRLFSCSRRMQQKSQSSTKRGTDSDYSEYTSEKPMLSDQRTLPCSSECSYKRPNNYSDRMVVVSTLRNSEGNILSTRTASSHRSFEDDMSKIPGLVVDSSKEEGSNHEFQVLSFEEPEHQPNCFPRTLRLQKKFRSSNASQTTCCTKQHNKTASSSLSKTSFGTCLVGNDSYVFCSGACNNTDSCINENTEEEFSHALLENPMLHSGKALQLRHKRQHLNRGCWILPCATAK